MTVAKNHPDSSGAMSVVSSHTPSCTITAWCVYSELGYPWQIKELTKSEGQHRLEEVTEGFPWMNRSKQMLHNHNFSKIILTTQAVLRHLDSQHFCKQIYESILNVISVQGSVSGCCHTDLFLGEISSMVISEYRRSKRRQKFHSITQKPCFQ